MRASLRSSISTKGARCSNAVWSPLHQALRSCVTSLVDLDCGSGVLSGLASFIQSSSHEGFTTNGNRKKTCYKFMAEVSYSERRQQTMDLREWDRMGDTPKEPAYEGGNLSAAT